MPQLLADERAMRQICLNLLSNAIKFTPPAAPSRSTVGADRHRRPVPSVKDTGPGIPENEIPRVLRSFGQGSLAHQTAEGGTGLGLPITKGLTELHDGTFELKSKLATAPRSSSPSRGSGRWRPCPRCPSRARSSPKSTP